MALHRIEMINWSTMGDTQLGALEAPSFNSFRHYSVNKQWDHMIIQFLKTGPPIPVMINGKFVVPPNYVGSPKFIVVWTTAAISSVNKVRWQIDYRAVGGDNTESLDQSTAQETLAVSDAVPSGVNTLNRLEAPMSATAANFAAHDEVQWEFSRQSAHADDSHSGIAFLFFLLFEYSDS